jgi:hypothetical protein
MHNRLPRFPYSRWIEMIAGGAIAFFLIDKLAKCSHRGHRHSSECCEPDKKAPDTAEQHGETKE